MRHRRRDPETDREFDALLAARARRHVPRVLRRRQHLREQCAELHFAPAAAALDVCQHAAQVADARRQCLHLAQALVHLLQPIRHLLERLAEPLVERRLELLVDGRPYLVQLLRIFAAQDVEPLLDGRAYRLEALFVGPRELGEPVAELDARRPSHRRLLAARVREILLEIALEIRGGFLSTSSRVRIPRRPAWQERSKPQQHGDHQRGDDDERDTTTEGCVRRGAEFTALDPSCDSVSRRCTATTQRHTPGYAASRLARTMLVSTNRRCAAVSLPHTRGLRRFAARLLALVFFQVALADSNRLRRDLDQLVVGDELDRVLERELDGRGERDRVVLAR